MPNTQELLTRYAHYHRDRRNITTHLIGVPMIVLAVGVLLARARFELVGFPLSAAWLAWAASTAWYLSRGQGLVEWMVSGAVGALVGLAHPLADGSTAHWLGWGVGLFSLGWVIQFVGHYFEGRKPAFVDDLVGLLVGPLFVVAELLFALGLCLTLRHDIEAEAGPTRSGPAPSAAKAS
ncbi:DUF962 domain-containing protein [Curvibacter sp. RS43]|jgi:uncharacterized membrane protein YGL010W|uniref:Mpo1 family 2-hydroxy fatty acid dioxygenase n=1 Tax=Curvibacter microcysteis TaxID=3026419 RepID=UPI0023611771|nr:Mpo1-like protein [Curvibacter sp. RS43]MDD0810506.1 DUF962 domain-containing protein [Curvibacter sp. RS43]